MHIHARVYNVKNAMFESESRSDSGARRVWLSVYTRAMQQRCKKQPQPRRHRQCWFVHLKLLSVFNIFGSTRVSVCDDDGQRRARDSVCVRARNRACWCVRDKHVKGLEIKQRKIVLTICGEDSILCGVSVFI